MKIFTLLIGCLVAFEYSFAAKKNVNKELGFKIPEELVAFKDRFDFKLAESGSNRFRVRLENMSEDKVGFRLKATPHDRYPISPSWIKLPSSVVFLAGKESKDIYYEVYLPNDSPEAGAFKLSYEIEKEYLKDKTAIISNSVVAFNVKDKVKHRVSIVHEVDIMGKKPLVKLKILNNGEGILYGVKADLVLLNKDDTVIFKTSTEDRFALIGKGRDYSVESLMRIPLPPGEYRIMTILSSHRDASVKEVKNFEFKVK